MASTKPARAKTAARAPRRAKSGADAPDAAFEARIGRKFTDKALLREALTHASFAEGRSPGASYERMEFLGDRVLGLVVAQLLYERFPQVGEDALALRLNALVSRGACARAARRIGLGAMLRLSPAEERTGGREKETILADACEGLIAAIYLDAGARGLKAARTFIEAVWSDEIDAVATAPRDPKTALQEWAAQSRRAAPQYEVVERTGPDHAPHFVVEARIAGAPAGRGSGASKRDAERAAARALLEAVGVHA